MNAADDLKLVADLIASGKVEAGERLARVLSELEVEREAHEVFESEARWLLSYARRLPCSVETLQGDREDREQVVKRATPADPNVGSCDYVLQDCPRLRSLMDGKFSAR